MVLGVSGEMEERIEELAHRTGDTKAEVLNKAIGLYKLASDAARSGKRVVIVDDERDEENEIVGF
jgi:predicted DNA-binding protein